MKIKVIREEGAIAFEEKVNEYLKRWKELILHDKTVFGINQKSYWTEGYVEQNEIYSVIFYGEL